MATYKEVSKGGNVTYYINADEGVVTARIEGNKYEAYHIITSIVDKLKGSDRANSPFDAWADFSSLNTFRMRPYYIGVARCMENDTFDVETGKRIALAKAQEKYHSDLKKRLSMMSMYFCEISQRVERRALSELEQSRLYRDAYSVEDE